MANMFLLNAFDAGISDYEGKGVKGSFKLGTAVNIRKKIDSLSCNNDLLAVASDVITGLVLWIVPASDGNTYLFDDGGKIYKMASNGAVSLVYTDADGKITGATEWCDNTGKFYLYWTTATKLHRKVLPGQANWSDVDGDATWPKSNLSSQTWHTMRPAGGALMICNGQYLAMVGYDNSYTTNAIDLIPGNVSKALIERSNGVIAGTGRKDSQILGTLFAWTSTALSWVSKRDIPEAGVNGLIDTDILLAQVGANGGLYFSDMANLLPVTRFPGGGKVNPGGVTQQKGLSYWGVFGASTVEGEIVNGIYSYGREQKNRSVALNLEYPIDADEIGAVGSVSGTLYVSYKKGSNYYFKKVDTTKYQEAHYYSLDLKAPNKSPMETTTWQGLKLETKDMPTGTAIEAWYRVNKNGSFIQALLTDGVTQQTVGKEAFFMFQEVGDIFELKLKLIPNSEKTATPEVYKALIYLE